MSLHEAQELHGLLNFASGFFVGRGLRRFCFRIFDLVSRREDKSKALTNWCRDLATSLKETPPRQVSCNSPRESVLIFTDGSWENGIGGLGAVVLDPLTSTRLVIQDTVDQRLLDLWRSNVGEQLICQIELLAVVLIRWEIQNLFPGRRVMIFIDNNSSRLALLKGTSKSPSMHVLIDAFYAAETKHPMLWWLERIPSASNPADEPSRMEGIASAKTWGAVYQDKFQCQPFIAEWIIKALQKVG